MGMDLISDHGVESFNCSGWRYCLETAERFGWKPEGTLAGRQCIGEWDGGYYGNDYQKVTDRDACALGGALLRAVAALTPKERAQEQAKVRVHKEWPALLKPKPTNPATKLLADILDEDDASLALDCLRRLADYALKGGFEIW